MSDNNGAPVGANLFEVRTDEVLEAKGVWCLWPQEGSDTEFLIASSKTPLFSASLTKELRKRRLSQDPKWAESVSGQKEATEARIAALAKAVLLNWRGDVFLEKGGPSEQYNHANAIKALNIRPFREWVEIMANREEQFQALEIAADEAAIKSSAHLVSKIPTEP